MNQKGRAIHPMALWRLANATAQKKKKASQLRRPKAQMHIQKQPQ